jgi:hypothetical protein
MRTESQAPPVTETPKIPRLRRGAAGVIAQYIQDLTRMPEPAPCVPAG